MSLSEQFCGKLREPSPFEDQRRLPRAAILEFKPERKLDFPLVIVQHAGYLSRASVRFFRERRATWVSGEYAGVQTRAAEIGMVEHVEEFRSELQSSGFSQEP